MSEANEKSIPSPVEDSDDLRKLYHQVLQQRSVAEQELFVEGLDYTKQEEGKVIRTLDARLFTAVLFSTFVLNIVSHPAFPAYFRIAPTSPMPFPRAYPPISGSPSTRSILQSELQP